MGFSTPVIHRIARADALVFFCGFALRRETGVFEAVTLTELDFLAAEFGATFLDKGFTEPSTFPPTPS